MRVLETRRRVARRRLAARREGRRQRRPRRRLGGGLRDHRGARRRCSARAVGCSRVVTSAGWRPHSDQVGQTGTKISPDLYVACGISGATQHIAGAKGAKKILAINDDPEAPIFANADYAVIGDLHEIVPAICAELRKVAAHSAVALGALLARRRRRQLFARRALLARPGSSARKPVDRRDDVPARVKQRGRARARPAQAAAAARARA